MGVLGKDREKILTSVDVVLSKFKALSGPSVEVLILKLGLIDGVLGGEAGNDVGVVGPLVVVERLHNNNVNKQLAVGKLRGD